MAETYKRLGGISPSTTEASLYTVPASTQAVVTVNVCNKSTSARTYRLGLVATNAAAGANDWLAYDKLIDPNDVQQFTGIGMNAANTLRGYASTADVTFVASGVEIV